MYDAIDTGSLLRFFRSFQIRLSRGRPRHVAERFSRVRQYQAEEGLVSRELSASQESRIRHGGATATRHIGGTCEFGEGQLRDEYRATQESTPRWSLR